METRIPAPSGRRARPSGAGATPHRRGASRSLGNHKSRQPIPSCRLISPAPVCAASNRRERKANSSTGRISYRGIAGIGTIPCRNSIEVPFLCTRQFESCHRVAVGLCAPSRRVSWQSRRSPPRPRGGPAGAGGGEERANSMSVTTTHALFARNVQRKPRYRSLGSHRAFVW